MELYKKHRPSKLKNVIGQESAVKILQKKIDINDVPHALLFAGPSGVGKTTIARILRKVLKCNINEYKEINGADERGIGITREIDDAMRRYPLRGNTKIFYIDEAHMLNKYAQNNMLKMLEDTPSHVYFMLATTEPQALKKTIRTRCTELTLKPIINKDLLTIIDSVTEAENKSIDDNIKDKIIECSDGSARKALVLLDAVIQLDDEEDMLQAIENTTQEKQAIELCRLLLNVNSKWSVIASTLKDLGGQDAEQLRRMVLGYMRTCLLSGSKISARAYYIITCFEKNFFDTGHAGLAMACWESMESK
jgi:DNA polymerase-3 subunit gamma/tau